VQSQLQDGEQVVASLGWALTRRRVLSRAGSTGQVGVEFEYALYGIKRPNVPIVVTDRRVFVLATTRTPSMLPHRVLGAVPRRDVQVRRVRVRRAPWLQLRRGPELSLDVEGSTLRLAIPFRRDGPAVQAIADSFDAAPT
jgi:hypothetical protein